MEQIKKPSESFPQEVAEFLIRAYFDIKENHLTGAIKRAYRDMNRTLRKFAEDKGKEAEISRERLRKKWRDYIKGRIEIILNDHFNTEEKFDLWHQETCKGLIKVDNLNLFTYGQAQKWINMTLKYLYIMGEKRVSGISKNYIFFHIPIDSYIQKEFLSFQVQPLPIAWSKLTFDQYIKYQNRLREVCKPRIPMDVEFELFNRAILNN